MTFSLASFSLLQAEIVPPPAFALISVFFEESRSILLQNILQKEFVCCFLE